MMWIITRRYLLVASILLSGTSVLHAGEKKHFFEVWEPPQALAEFWKPISESWWQKGPTPRLTRYCRDFARRSRPVTIIPAMIADLKANPSEIRPFVYINVMANWQRDTVLRVLKPFQRSRDPEIRNIATDFVADIETEN